MCHASRVVNALQLAILMGRVIENNELATYVVFSTHTHTHLTNGCIPVMSQKALFINRMLMAGSRARH